MLFKDRQHAGVLLSKHLAPYRGKSALIIGLARGGVITALPIARSLGMVLDVLVIKKVSSPHSREFAIGSVAQDGVYVIHWKDAHRTGADEAYIKQAVSRQLLAIRQQIKIYRKGKKPIQIEGRTVILVDDGAATGATMEAAVRWAKKKRAGEIVVAIPVVSKEAKASLVPEVDAFITHQVSEELGSVGEFYGTFLQVTDEEVIECLSVKY